MKIIKEDIRPTKTFKEWLTEQNIDLHLLTDEKLVYTGSSCERYVIEKSYIARLGLEGEYGIFVQKHSRFISAKSVSDKNYHEAVTELLYKLLSESRIYVRQRADMPPIQSCMMTDVLPIYLPKMTRIGFSDSELKIIC